jgi:hypothetical protein
MESTGKNYKEGWYISSEKWLVASEGRMAHCLMVAASVKIVLRRTMAANE